MQRTILILGGAGFLGSNIAKKFCKEGCSVTVIDGLFKNTGASVENLGIYEDNINFINKRVEQIEKLDTVLKDHELIIDAMGWTSHLEAVKDPFYDLELNIRSHLTLIKALEGQQKKMVIYLGSRGQYGNSPNPEIYETDPMVPEDVQGINKLTAESYYRIYSKIYGFNVISLRIPNCFGPGQIVSAIDVGLIGSFIKTALKGQVIQVFGNNRKRSVLFVNDLIKIVFNIAGKFSAGFQSFNINGITIPIVELAQAIVDLTKEGTVKIQSLPDEIKNIDMGSSKLNEDKLRNIIPELKYSDLNKSLIETINYFRQRL